jgi:hypothetical protein
VTSYGLDGRGFDSRQKQDFSLPHSVQTGSGAHPASYSIGTGGSFPGRKRQGREADHPPPSSAEVKNGSAIPPLLHTTSWHGGLIDQAKGQLYLTIIPLDAIQSGYPGRRTIDPKSSPPRVIIATFFRIKIKMDVSCHNCVMCHEICFYSIYASRPL